MRITSLAFVAALSLAAFGCGSSSKTTLDGGTSGGADMSGGGGGGGGMMPDLRKVQRGCAYFGVCYSDTGGDVQGCLSKLSMAEAQKLIATIDCFQAACGYNGNDGGAKPCTDTSTDMGRATCDLCGDLVYSTPAMGGTMPGINYGTNITCGQGAGTDPNCGACYNVNVACDGSCVIDDDCSGLRDQSGNSPPCVNGSCLGM
jgi:hypothetical protein